MDSWHLLPVRKNSTAVCGVYNMSRVCSAFPLISSRLSLRLLRSRPVRHLSQEFLSSVVITRFTCTSALTASLSRPVCVDSERLVPDATSSTNTTVTSRDAPTRRAVIFNVTYRKWNEKEGKLSALIPLFGDRLGVCEAFARTTECGFKD